MNCTKNIEPNSSSCVQPCDGMVVSSYLKSEFEENKKSQNQKPFEYYENYKMGFKLKQGIKG